MFSVSDVLRAECASCLRLDEVLDGQHETAAVGLPLPRLDARKPVEERGTCTGEAVLPLCFLSLDGGAYRRL